MMQCNVIHFKLNTVQSIINAALSFSLVCWSYFYQSESYKYWSYEHYKGDGFKRTGGNGVGNVSPQSHFSIYGNHFNGPFGAFSDFQLKKRKVF